MDLRNFVMLIGDPKNHSMTLVIAEAGVNHNGDENLAFELIDIAKSAGADVVKFQLFQAEKLTTQKAELAEYQKKNISTDSTQSQYDMLQKLELSPSVFSQLANYCSTQGIEFLSTAFDTESLNFLVHDLGIKKLKIASGELTNAPFLLEHSRTGVDIILSTGMSSLAEITEALGVIAFGYLNLDGYPSKPLIAELMKSNEAREIISKRVTLMHCTSAYPAPLDQLNLRAMHLLRDEFKTRVGYSDHSDGILISPIAVAMGASVIEKHFTKSKKMQGPDHQASLEPNELSSMIIDIRNVEIGLGKREKAPTSEEKKNLLIARKSIVANTPIQQGDIFSEANLSVKRPGSGMQPIKIWDLIGRQSQNRYDIGELINEKIDKSNNED